jgi:hypothetical protein
VLRVEGTIGDEPGGLITLASCNLIGPIEQCILQVVESVFFVSLVESERPFPDKEPEVALEPTVIGL